MTGPGWKSSLQSLTLVFALTDTHTHTEETYTHRAETHTQRRHTHTQADRGEHGDDAQE